MTKQRDVAALVVDPEITSIAGVTSAADKVPYYTAAGTASVATLNSYGRTLIGTDSTSALLLPAGNTAARPSPVTGHFRFNSETVKFEGYNGSAWTVVDEYDANTAKLNVTQSWTNQQTFKELKDTVHTITDGAAFEIDPVNGSIQTVTLGASRTPAATNFESGQVVLLGIDDGTAYTVTWTSVAPTWIKAGGSATAPTLATTGYTWILLWKVGSTIYATEVGQP